jgi:hypothetical protein
MSIEDKDKEIKELKHIIKDQQNDKEKLQSQSLRIAEKILGYLEEDSP